MSMVKVLAKMGKRLMGKAATHKRSKKEEKFVYKLPTRPQLLKATTTIQRAWRTHLLRARLARAIERKRAEKELAELSVSLHDEEAHALDIDYGLMKADSSGSEEEEEQTQDEETERSLTIPAAGDDEFLSSDDVSTDDDDPLAQEQRRRKLEERRLRKVKQRKLEEAKEKERKEREQRLKEAKRKRRHKRHRRKKRGVRKKRTPAERAMARIERQESGRFRAVEHEEDPYAIDEAEKEAVRRSSAFSAHQSSMRLMQHDLRKMKRSRRRTLINAAQKIQMHFRMRRAKRELKARRIRRASASVEIPPDRLAVLARVIVPIQRRIRNKIRLRERQLERIRYLHQNEIDNRRKARRKKHRRRKRRKKRKARRPESVDDPRFRAQLEALHIEEDGDLHTILLDISSAELNDMKVAFDVFDSGSGYIRTASLGPYLRALGQNPTRAELDLMRRQMDQDNDSRVTFKEFVHWYRKRKTIFQSEELVKELFRLFDVNGNGFVSHSEIMEAMVRLKNPLTEEEVEEMIRANDVSLDGQLNLREFKRIAEDAL